MNLITPGPSKEGVWGCGRSITKSPNHTQIQCCPLGNHSDFSSTYFRTVLSARLWGQKGERGVCLCLQNCWYLCFGAELAWWMDPWPSTAPRATWKDLLLLPVLHHCGCIFSQNNNDNRILLLFWKKDKEVFYVSFLALNSVLAILFIILWQGCSFKEHLS